MILKTDMLDVTLSVLLHSVESHVDNDDVDQFIDEISFWCNEFE